MARSRRRSLQSWWVGPALGLAVVGIAVAALLVARGADGAALVTLGVAAAAAAGWFTVVAQVVLRRSAALLAGLDVPELTRRLDVAVVTTTARSGRRRAIPEAGEIVRDQYPDLTPRDAEAVVRRLLVHAGPPAGDGPRAAPSP